MTDAGIITGIVLFALAFAIVLHLIKSAMSREAAATRARHAQDVYLVSGPQGDQEVTGNLRIELASGLLSFRTADDMVTETFAPGGWWRVVKIREAA